MSGDDGGDGGDGCDGDSDLDENCGTMGDATLIPLVLAAAQLADCLQPQVTLIPAALSQLSIDVDSKSSTELGSPSQSEPIARRASKVPMERRTTELDFKHRLEMILSMEEGTSTLARKIYTRFQGDISRVPEFLQFLDATWGFPPRLFPLLWTQLRRAVFHHRGEQAAADIGSSEAPANVSESEWVQAFGCWLEAVHSRCAPANLSRRGFVRMRQAKKVGDVKDTYFQGPKLGEGAYGEVHVMFHKGLGVERAVKTIHKEQLSIATRAAEVEVNVLTSLDHPHIVRIYEAFEADDVLHIVMDYAEGGDLASVIDAAKAQVRPLAENWVCTASQQICAALAYMHAQGVIHCDLKPANAMLLKPVDPYKSEMPHILLVDFGISEIFLDSNRCGQMKVRGTPLYLAPEAFEGDLTEKSDVWALAIMIYEMLAGDRPFQADNVVVLLSKVATVEPSLTKFPILAREVLRALLAKDPIARLTATECLSLEWFVSRRPKECVVSADASTLENISHVSYFHRAAMFCIAADLSMKQMGDLYEIFNMMDTNNTGTLSYDQFAAGLRRLGSTKDPRDLIAILDSDRSGVISYTEFLAAILGSKQQVSEQLLREAFSVFDLDGDGLISMHELRMMLSGGGPLVEVLPDGQTIDDVMEEVGRGEGFVSFPNFVEYVRQAANAPSASPSNADITSPSSRKNVVLDGMLSDLDIQGGLGELKTPGRGRASREQKSVEPCKRESKHELLPLHRLVSNVQGDQDHARAVRRVLQFSGQPLDPPLTPKSLAAVQAHFAACAKVVEGLAGGYHVDDASLRIAVRDAASAIPEESKGRRPVHALRVESSTSGQRRPGSKVGERQPASDHHVPKAVIARRLLRPLEGHDDASPPAKVPRIAQSRQKYQFRMDRAARGVASEPSLSAETGAELSSEARRNEFKSDGRVVLPRLVDPDRQSVVVGRYSMLSKPRQLRGSSEAPRRPPRHSGWRP